ncbi:MAG TPA: NfeD family protein [Isosphaeraceae bacterium]|nr:NfeD family protein [Isosphaeraceae bacterium]
MIRSRAAHRRERVWPLLARLLLVHLIVGVTAAAQGPAPRAEETPGQFFTVTEPITSETVERIKAGARQLIDSSATAERGQRPILVFEFIPGESAPGSSSFGASVDLANLISHELSGAKLTVAFVPQPLSGYAVLPVVACSEIVMGPTATLGPITPEGQHVHAAYRGVVHDLAVRKARDPDLLLGMLDRDADLRLVRTADKTVRYILAENLPEFLKSHQVIEEQPAWEGRRGVLTAGRARQEGFCKLTADSPAELAAAYQIAGHSAVDDPTLGQLIRPAWVRLEGPLDPVMHLYLKRSLEQARRDKINLMVLEINSPGGSETVADGLADLISEVKDMKTVAYIEDRALGVAALLPLACRDIVFKRAARMGDVQRILKGHNGQDLADREIQLLAGKAALLARLRGHPEAVARAMVDPNTEVLEARDSKTGATRLILQADIQNEPGRYQQIAVRKEPGSVLTVSANEAAAYGLGQVVQDAEELKGLYGLRGRPIRVDGPGWVDSLVAFLTEPLVSWVLLFLGVFMLVIEFKLPGIGLPAITSALAFLLFFWSHYLSGTADQLEIILFLIGLVCLALELFVFPGFGIFGMSGILLMLCSIVMASHSFVWPTHDYEYRELSFTLLQVTGMLLAVGIGAVILARYFPSLPLFNRLILKPEPWTSVEPDDPMARPVMEGYESLAFLIGETGRTTSPLRPTGKARFGNHLIDVTAAGAFVESDSLVEVVDVQGARVVVKKL